MPKALGPWPIAPARAARVRSTRGSALKALILRGPDLERDGCWEWRIADLRRIAHERFGVAYAETGMLRLVESLNLSRQKARPQHPRADRTAPVRFKRGCPIG